MQTSVTCRTIGNLDDGTAEAAINAAIRAAAKDTEDRGEDGKVRKVQITLEFIQVDSKHVSVTCEVGTATPKYRTGGTLTKLSVASGRAELLFNDMAADDPDQRTVDEYIEPKGE